MRCECKSKRREAWREPRQRDTDRNSVVCFISYPKSGTASGQRSAAKHCECLQFNLNSYTNTIVVIIITLEVCRERSWKREYPRENYQLTPIYINSKPKQDFCTNILFADTTGLSCCCWCPWPRRRRCLQSLSILSTFILGSVCQI